VGDGVHFAVKVRSAQMLNGETREKKTVRVFVMYVRACVRVCVCVNPSSSNMNVWMCAQECAMHI